MKMKVKYTASVVLATLMCAGQSQQAPATAEKLAAMDAIVFLSRYPDSNTGGKEDLEAFKAYLATAQINWAYAKELTSSTHIKPSAKMDGYNSVPMKLDHTKLYARHYLSYLKKRQEKLRKTEYPPELVCERDALLDKGRLFGEALDSYIKQDIRAATDKILNDFRRNANDHIADSDRMWSPVAISLWAPVQWPRTDADVAGLGLNTFYGKYHNVYGMDIASCANEVSSSMAGIQLAGFLNRSDMACGIQLAAIQNDANELVGGVQIAYFNVNSCYGSWLQVGGYWNESGFFTGAQVAGFENTAYSCNGLQLGLSNHAQELAGVQIGVFNDAKELYGVQIGIFNKAKELYGVQIGVFNKADKAKGLGVGVLNMIGEANCYCLPILNMNF